MHSQYSRSPGQLQLESRGRTGGGTGNPSFAAGVRKREPRDREHREWQQAGLKKYGRGVPANNKRRKGSAGENDAYDFPSDSDDDFDLKPVKKKTTSHFFDEEFNRKDPGPKPRAPGAARRTTRGAANPLPRKPLGRGPRKPKEPEVVELSDTDSEEVGAAPAQEAGGSVVFDLFDGALDPTTVVERVWIGDLAVEGAHVLLAEAGATIVFDGGQVGAGAGRNLQLAMDWGAIQSAAFKGNPQPGSSGTSLLSTVVLGLPQAVASLGSYLDPTSADRRKRAIVLQFGGCNPAWTTEVLADLWKRNAHCKAAFGLQKGWKEQGRHALVAQDFSRQLSGDQEAYYQRVLDDWPGEAAEDAGRPLGLGMELVGVSTRRTSRRLSQRTGGRGLKQPLVYPSKKHPRAVVVQPGDLYRLRGLEFLNDTLIDFYLLYITHQLFPGRCDRVHIFNTFFYKKLVQSQRSAQEVKEAVGTKMAAHKRVASWTSQVDLFEKDFVLVPINKSAHWILAIVCHPGAIAGGDPARHPGLVFLDSLGGRHEVSANVLTDYLTLEYHVKKRGLPTDGTDGCVQPKSLEPNFKDKAVVPVAYPHVPRQDNFCDCGLFVCHYAEKFVEATPATVLVPHGGERRGAPPVLNLMKGEGETWPYCFRTRWFPAVEASQKRGELLLLLLEIERATARAASATVVTDRLQLGAAGEAAGEVTSPAKAGAGAGEEDDKTEELPGAAAAEGGPGAADEADEEDEEEELGRPQQVTNAHLELVLQLTPEAPRGGRGRLVRGDGRRVSREGARGG